MTQTRYMPRADWLRWRREGITATDASIIMGAVPKSWGTIHEIWLDKTGKKIFHKQQTPRMLRGIKLELMARNEYQARTGRLVPDTLVENIRRPVLRTSLDGIEHGVLVWENKCPNAVDHAIAKANGIPKKYVWQCVHHLMVTELPLLHYNSFDGKNGVTVEFKRDLTLEAQLLEKEMWFWDYVLSDTAPPPPPEPKRLKTNATFQEKWENVLEFRSRK